MGMGGGVLRGRRNIRKEEQRGLCSCSWLLCGFFFSHPLSALSFHPLTLDRRERRIEGRENQSKRAREGAREGEGGRENWREGERGREGERIPESNFFSSCCFFEQDY